MKNVWIGMIMKSVLCGVALGVVSAPVFAEVMCPELLGACVGEDHVLRVVDRMEDCGPNSDWMQISALKPYASVRLVDADGFVIHEYGACVNDSNQQNGFPHMLPNNWQSITTNQGYSYNIAPNNGMPSSGWSVYFESSDCSGVAWQAEIYSYDPPPSGGEEFFFEETMAYIHYIPGNYVYYTPPGEKKARMTSESVTGTLKSMISGNTGYTCSEFSAVPNMIYYLSPMYVNDPSVTGVPFVTEADAPTLPLRVEKIPAPRRAAPVASPNP